MHRAVRDEFVELLARRVTERILLGDPFDDATTMGPLNNEPVAAKMDEHVGDAVARGASVVSGGARAEGFATSLYWQPTVLTDVPADARVAVEETFGPIAPVVAIDSLEHAIELTNASPYGLLAAIFTANLQDGLEFADRVHTGWVNINESSNYWEAHLPFGGRAGTDSGIGRVGGSHVMQSFTELQTVVLSPHAARVNRAEYRQRGRSQYSDGRYSVIAAPWSAQSTARISRSNVAMCPTRMSRARSGSPAEIASSTSWCSCTRANRCGSRSITRYQIRSDRLK